MGNLCGKQEPEATPPGRVLGPAPPFARKTASVPSAVGGPARTLGRAADAPPAPAPADDARRRAADAAEARARAAGKGGKLQRQLSAQKRLSRSEALKQASEQQRRARDADEAALARNWE